jgi:hypothetical protein
VPQLVCQACGEPLQARDTKPANSKPKDADRGARRGPGQVAHGAGGR